MANCTLHSLFRDCKNRLTDRETFAQVVSRLSAQKDEKAETGSERKAVRGSEKAA